MIMYMKYIFDYNHIYIYIYIHTPDTYIHAYMHAHIHTYTIVPTYSIINAVRIPGKRYVSPMLKHVFNMNRTLFFWLGCGLTKHR